MTADQFKEKLTSMRTPNGIRMGQIFALAKENIGMPLEEVVKLLKSPKHEARVGAVSIMDFQARSKKNLARRPKSPV